MKKIINIVLSFLILTSCGIKKEAVNNDLIRIKNNGNNTEKIQRISNVPTEEIVNENFNECWTFYGNGEYTSDINKKNINILNGDNNILNTSLTSNEFMLKNGEYSVSFVIISDIEKNISLVIGDNDTTFINETLKIKNGVNEFDLQFSNNLDTIYNTVVSFFLGDNSSIEQHIEINDFSLSSNYRTIGSRINQIGFLSNMEKQVVFSYQQGNYFNICRFDDNEIVYSGPIGECVYENDSNEYLYKSFFTDFKEEGKYYIKSELGGYSYPFEISDNVYADLKKDVLNFIYLQRCGMDINDNLNIAALHKACHLEQAQIYTSLGDYYIDASGGWHDAGDYGKYMQTSNKTIADLLFAFIYGEDKREELLEEIKWGLDWSMKMQRDDGGTYNKVTSKSFASFVLPENDKKQQYVLYAWTTTTASFAGIMGLAYEAYKEIDEEYANKCLEAHKKAISYLNNHGDMDCTYDPKGFGAGYYSPGDENDERLFAYIEAYRIDKNEQYLNKIKELIQKGICYENSYNNFSMYSYVLLIDTFAHQDNIYMFAKNELKKECDLLVSLVGSNAYSYALDVYSVGSNQNEAEAINKLLLGYMFLNNKKYLAEASKSFGYLLGMNTIDMSFVYGYGYNYPKTMHHRVAEVNRGIINGALAGGVCEWLSEGRMSDYFDDTTPRAKRFADNSDSYSNVEPTIYYNSALVLSISLLETLNNAQNN